MFEISSPSAIRMEREPVDLLLLLRGVRWEGAEGAAPILSDSSIERVNAVINCCTTNCDCPYPQRVDPPFWRYPNEYHPPIGRVICCGTALELSGNPQDCAHEVGLAADMLKANGVAGAKIKALNRPYSTLSGIIECVEQEGLVDDGRRMEIVAHGGHLRRALGMCDFLLPKSVQFGGLVVPGEQDWRTAIRERVLRFRYGRLFHRAGPVPTSSEDAKKYRQRLKERELAEVLDEGASSINR